MKYAVEPDVIFLADALQGLAKLNVRHFREDLELAKTVLRRMLEGDYEWIQESPDTWQDVKEMANSRKRKFDCEDFAAAFAALMVICFGEASVGIRRVDEHQCHALAGQGKSVYDICPLFGMQGTTSGAGEWRTIKDKPMPIAEVGALIVSGVRRLMAQTKEPEQAQVPADTDTSAANTGASAANVARSFVAPVAIDRLEELDRAVAALKKERDALKKERDTIRKERDALKKGLVDMTASRNDQSARRITAESAMAKTKEQLAAESRRLAEARAFHQACKEQLQQVLARSNDADAKRLAQDGLDRLDRESPEDYADAFDDDEQRSQAWEMLGTGAAHIASLADCDACARGEACTRTGGTADEANGDDPPDNTSGPDSDEYVGGYEGPPSSDRQMSFSGCDGSCPR